MSNAQNRAPFLSATVGMWLKRMPLLALGCLLVPWSNAPTTVSVFPAAGGEGIQAALDALPKGGTVSLSAGVYLVRQPIMLRKDGQTLQGCGDSTLLSLADSANCPVVVLGAPMANGDAPIRGVRLEDLSINGNRQHQEKEVWRVLPDGAGVYNNGVDVWRAVDATVERVECGHCRSGGMVAAAGTRRLTVRDYTAFDNQFDGLACYATEDSHFSHLDLRDNLAAGLSLDLGFNHNVIDGAVLTGGDLGIFMRQSRGNYFEGVTIQKSRHHGVFMAESGYSTPSGWHFNPGSECTDNRFNGLSISHCGGKAFLVNDAGCVHNIIDHWSFRDNAQGGLAQAEPNLVAVGTSEPTEQPARTTEVVPVLQLLRDASAPSPAKALQSF